MTLWDYTVVIPIIWALQFIVACLMFSGSGEGWLLHPDATQYSVLSTSSPSKMNANFCTRICYCTLSFLLLVTVITEICLFANDCLSLNTYLSLQIGKMVYISVVFGIYAPIYFKYANWGDLGVVWMNVWQIGVYL
jgi:hypothetical protein